MFEGFVETPDVVQGYVIDKDIVMLTANCVQVFSGRTRLKRREARVFEKDGKARKLHADDAYVYCTDFVQLNILDRQSLEVLTQLQLGTDLRSDICGGALDDAYLYLGIRNGPLARVRKRTWDVEFFPVSTSSFWTLGIDGNLLYGGNVAGELLVIDTASVTVVHSLPAHRQNLKSLCIRDDHLATASQDLALKLWNKTTLEPVAARRKAHRRAFAIAGFWKGYVVTVSYPCGEIKVWDLEDLEEKAVFPIASCLSGKAVIRTSNLYLSSRAINGIDRADLNAALGRIG